MDLELDFVFKLNSSVVLFLTFVNYEFSLISIDAAITLLRLFIVSTLRYELLDVYSPWIVMRFLF